jgi:hypothetical protein
MAERIRNHLRSNVVGYLAMFVALSGSAYAAAEIGSDDIRRNAVLSKHLRKNAVKTQDISNRRGVTTRDVKNENLRSADVKDAGLQPKDVAGLEDLIAKVNSLSGGVGALPNVPATDLSQLDARLDALCAQADAVNQEFNDLLAANPFFGLTGVSLPNFDPAACQG